MEERKATDSSFVAAISSPSPGLNGQAEGENSKGKQPEVQESTDESSRLKALQAEVRDQDDLERDIGRQADKLLLEQANERDNQRFEKTNAQRDKLLTQIRKLKDRISEPIGTAQRAKLKIDIERFEKQVHEFETDLAQIQERIDERNAEAHEAENAETTASGRLPNESQRDYLIRTGKITPFSRFGLSSFNRTTSNLQDALLDAEEERESGEDADYEEGQGSKQLSHRNLTKPGFMDEERTSDSDYVDEEDINRHRKRARIEVRKTKHTENAEAAVSAQGDILNPNQESDSGDAFVADETEESLASDDDFPSTKSARGNKRKTAQEPDDVEDLRGIDDGKESVYQARVRSWSARRSHARRRAEKRRQAASDLDHHEPRESYDEDDDANVETEAHHPHPTIPDTVLEGGFRIPGDVYPSLFDYQKTGVQWLWELYSQQVGAIVGDEMGLGKTIQIISFLAGLHYSKKLTKPIIIVCPATVMKQWVNEFHQWWPPFRVTILHSSGSGMINVRNESSREDDLVNQIWNPTSQNRVLTASQKAAEKVLKKTLSEAGVLVTTYSGLQSYAPLLIPVDWQYAVLDEGHKIRNPNTAITIYCKELRTPNRIILSGTPMQNNLVELWSLFDFVFPMRLGTLVNFRTQFEIPIRQGGYANASNLQVQTALKCAETLKDAISPYLLQRFKVDVAADLPKKSEQVLFCRLTKIQRKAYEDFLASDDMKSIMAGKRQVLYGVDILRKICNHPDLQDHKYLATKPGYNYGSGVKSGKMQVVSSLLELWKDTGHKTLLFAQHRIMLDILEKFIRSTDKYNYRRMDGNTPIHARQSMVDEFNNSPDLHVFLLTTKVGGLGINLTGADRVIIFDPDWNPSTDLQARERAWRLGQKREVTIYRLMTAGTIEEKIYHRQIFKQFLTNKILRDPKQRQTFHLSDLHDLFSLGDEQGPTETSTLFKDAEVTYGNGSGPAGTKGKEPATAQAAALDRENVNALTGISSVERYAGDVQDEESASASNGREPTSNGNGAPSRSEARVMESIFARTGIHSAVEHDDIINGGQRPKRPVIRADPQMIEREARKVANEAAAELKKAGQIARTVPIGTPTWTGQFGIAGRPEETTPSRAFSTAASRAGPSSSSLLAGLAQRGSSAAAAAAAATSSPSSALGGGNAAAPAALSTRSTPAATNSRVGTPSAAATARGKDWGKLIKDYLVSHGGSVYTQMLIDHFNRYCSTEQATTEFRETLKAIARLDKSGRGQGRGKWVLKDEYK